MGINTIDECEFYKLLEKEKLFIVNFSADWCSDCKSADALLNEFSEENPQLKIFRIDVGEYTDIANNFGVINVPSVLVFSNKKVKSRAEGKFTINELSELI